MITVEHLKIFYRYDEEIDAWARFGSKQRKAVMTDEIWSLVENLKTDLEMIKNNITSKEFKHNTLKELEILTDAKTRMLLVDNKKP